MVHTSGLHIWSFYFLNKALFSHMWTSLGTHLDYFMKNIFGSGYPFYLLSFLICLPKKKNQHLWPVYGYTSGFVYIQYVIQMNIFFYLPHLDCFLKKNKIIPIIVHIWITSSTNTWSPLSVRTPSFYPEHIWIALPIHPWIFIYQSTQIHLPSLPWDPLSRAHLDRFLQRKGWSPSRCPAHICAHLDGTLLPMCVWFTFSCNSGIRVGFRLLCWTY